MGAQTTPSESRIDLEDGSYIIVTIEESDSWSGNKAFGYATLGRLYGGLVVDEYSYTLTLTCDPNGNVS